MTIPELFTTLRRLDIALWADGEQLRYSAPPGTLSGELRGEIRRHRQEIVGCEEEVEALL